MDIILGKIPGRESAAEQTHFNAVGLALADVGIAHVMYERAKAAGAGTELTIQDKMIFEHEDLKDWVRL